MSLADVLIGDPDDQSRVPELRSGVVTATSPLAVRVGSAATAVACRALASYFGVIGDAVQVLVVDGDRIVLGRTKTAAPAQYVAASGTSGTTSSTTESSVCQITATATGVAGYVMVLGHAFLSFSTFNDNYECFIDVDGGGIGAAAASDRLVAFDTGWSSNAHPIGVFFNDGASHIYRLKVQRTFGSGTASYFGSDPRYGLLHVVFFPGA